MEQENNALKINEFFKDFPEVLWKSAELIHLGSGLGITHIPEEIFDRFTYGISIGVPLSLTTMESIQDRPNSLYKYHYKNINSYLDEIVTKLSLFVESLGYLALSIPASGFVSNRIRTGHISHRHVAFLSGLGFYGLNNLIVHPEYGSAIRLVSLLTTMPLPSGKILESYCSSCLKCISCCPAKAIGTSFEEFNRDACFEKVNEFARDEVGVQICGLCIKPCTGTRKIK